MGRIRQEALKWQLELPTNHDTKMCARANQKSRKLDLRIGQNELNFCYQFQVRNIIKPLSAIFQRGQFIDLDEAALISTILIPAYAQLPFTRSPVWIQLTMLSNH